MLGLAREPPGCSFAACGALSCPSPDLAATSRTPCSAGGAPAYALRCCPAAPYPEVFAWVDRGAASCFLDSARLSGLDASAIGAGWTNVKELQLLPGAAAP